MLKACIVNGAKSNRKGAAFKSAFTIISSPRLKDPSNNRYYNLKQINNGDKTHHNTMPVRLKGKDLIMRTRPIFEQWSLIFDALFDDTIIDVEDVKEAIKVGGSLKAIGDYRPEYGKFKVISIS